MLGPGMTTRTGFERDSEGMSIPGIEPTRPLPHRTVPDGRLRLSRPSVVILATSFAAGTILGGVIYLNRSPHHNAYVEGTDAFWQHMVVFAVAAVVAVIVLRRSHTRPLRLLLAPLGAPAAGRLALTVRSSPRHPTALLRLLLSIVPLALLVFFPFRAGVQVLGGLDPNYVVNAWGGPSYLGAMAFHYIDAALLVAVSAGLLNVLLLRREN